MNGGRECPPLIENRGCFRTQCGGRELGKHNDPSGIFQRKTVASKFLHGQAFHSLYLTCSIHPCYFLTFRLFLIDKNIFDVEKKIRAGLGEFETVMQTLDYVSGLHNFREFTQPPSV